MTDALYDEAGILQRTGVRPDQYVHYAALRGDSSDNLPGVPKVGEKTAAKLINTYGDLDGIFANATLFHVPTAALPRVLRELHATLKPRGVLFSSNPRGSNEEGWSNGRYGVYHDLAAWQGYLTAAGFEELTHYYRPEGLPREQQPWLASVWRRA